MKAHPRVMFVSNSASGGGAERATNIIVDALYARGFPVSLCTINSGPEDLIRPSCQTFFLNRCSRSGILKTVEAFLEFKATIRRWRPDIIVFGCELPELFASASGKRFHKIIVLHTTEPWLGRRTLGKIVRFLLSRQKVSWVAVSEHINTWGFGNRTIEVIPNPVIASFDLAEVKEKKTKEIERLLFIGRLSEEKQPELVLELSQLTRLPSLIIGTGPLLNKLTTLSKEYSLETEFYGYALNPWAQVVDGDLLIIPSRFEGDGLVVLEAISNNVPFVMNDIPDLRRFGFAENFYFNSVADLAHRIKGELLRLDELVLTFGIRTRILESRSVDKIANEWEKYLLQCLDPIHN